VSGGQTTGQQTVLLPGKPNVITIYIPLQFLRMKIQIPEMPLHVKQKQGPIKALFNFFKRSC